MARLHDELLAAKPADARHDVATCPFCVDNATASHSGPVASSHEVQASPTAAVTQDPTQVPGIPPASGRSGTTTTRTEHTEGGTPSPMTTITESAGMSRETHEALLAKAVTDATKTTDAALAAKTDELAAVTSERNELAAKVESLESDNARLNGELDNAQVAQKAAEDKAAELSADIAARDEAAQKQTLATERASQARNLGVWSEDQITEKASRWAELPETDWADRLEEWRHLGKPAATTTETASAMTGTSGSLTTDPATDEKKPSARRAVLGLD